MATVTTSKKFSLNLQDWQKALIIAVITPVITTMINSLNAGVLVFNWKLIITSSLGAGLAYILKNFLTPAQVVIKDVPKETVEAIQDGAAQAQIVQKP